MKIKQLLKEQREDLDKRISFLGTSILNMEKEPKMPEKAVGELLSFIHQSQIQLIKAVLDEMVGEEDLAKTSEYWGGYNQRIKEEEVKRDEILKELEI